MTDIETPQRPGYYRWVICGLLLTAMVINYTHRQMIGLLKDEFSLEFNLDENGYANIVLAFQAAYAIGYISFGRFIDKVGARIGYVVAFVVWTVAHTLTGAAMNVTQFAMARFAVGIGESGGFPASLKAVAEWFPQKERALAVGVFNAGTNLGAILAPWLVPIITLAWGWRAAFYVTGIVSLIWAVVWFIVYRRPSEHSQVGAAELAYINSDPEDQVAKPSWLKVFLTKETWAFALTKFLTDPIWWVYLFWLPDFFKKNYGLDIKTFGPPIIVIYLMSDVGSVLGGGLSSFLIRSGLSVNVARKATLFLFALLVLPIFLLDGVRDLWMAVFILGLATAAHQAFSANILTVPSDLFPRAAVGTVIGIGGTMGAIGGMFMAKFVGIILQITGSYHIIFMIAGSVYFIALLIMHLITPHFKRVEL